MNTRRYPRTCDEAFGPFQRSSQCEFDPLPDLVPPFTRAEIAVMGVCALATIFLAVLFTVEYLNV